MRYVALVPSLAVLFSTAIPVSCLSAEDATAEQPLVITASRLNTHPQSMPVTVIDGERLTNTGANDLTTAISRAAGLSTRSLYGANYGKGTTFDLRGFGETAGSNTLILLNGRRLNDIDLSAVDLSAIVPESVARVEILRGPVAGVVYGDGAIAGAINIVTHDTVDTGVGGRVAANVGDFGQQQTRGTVTLGHDNVQVRATGNWAESDGWRDNGALRTRSLDVEVGQQIDDIGWWLSGGYVSDEQGLPGTRTVGPAIDQTASDPRGTSKPNDRAESEGWRTAGGVTLDVDAGQITIDGGWRRRDSQGYFPPTWNTDARLDSWSFTPRADLLVMDDRLRIQSGGDLWYSQWENAGGADLTNPAQVKDADQLSVAVYSQATWSLHPAWEFSAGLRVQFMDLEVNDQVNTFGALKPDLNHDETEWAANIGLAHEVNEALMWYVGAGRNFRYPTIDERNATATNDFHLATQVAWSIELGAAYKHDLMGADINTYWMRVEDELQYDPGAGMFGANSNRDRLTRVGVDLGLSYRLFSTVDLRAMGSYVRARYEEGAYDGKQVPLVAPFSGRLQGGWQALPWLRLGLGMTAVDSRPIGNDNANNQPELDGYILVDAMLQVRYEKLTASLTVDNLTDESYANTAFMSGFVPNTWGVYTMPGRSLRLSMEATF